MRWRVAAGGLVVLGSVVAPGLAGGSDRVQAQCRAAFGSLNDGVCLDQPSGGGTNGSGPAAVGVGPTDNGGTGISTSPLFPGQTFNVPLGP